MLGFVVVDGILRVCPICKLYQFTPGLAASNASKLIPAAAAIALPVSPATTVYWVVWIDNGELSSSQGVLRTCPICKLVHCTVGFMDASWENSMPSRAAIPFPVSPDCTIHFASRFSCLFIGGWNMSSTAGGSIFERLPPAIATFLARPTGRAFVTVS